MSGKQSKHRKLVKWVTRTWLRLENAEPCISTEMLIHKVATHCNIAEDSVIDLLDMKQAGFTRVN